jgi:hypothetical protein
LSLISRRFLSLLALSVLGAVSQVQAQPLTLDGVWGNEAGCGFAKEGTSEDDSFVVLKADGVETYATACEWVQVATARDGAQVATGLCSYEGEEGRGVELFVIAPDLSDATLLRIYAANGEPWGEVRKCP